MSATWTPGTRFRVRPAGDRYDGVEGTARGSFTDPSGAEHVHARTDDGTHTTWPADRLERIETGLFQVGDRVMWSTGRGCPGTVESRDGWRYPEDLERFPNDVVVKWDDGMHSLVSPGALMAAPQDHGPLAAVLSDRTLAKVLSRPAHVPSGEATPTRVFGFNVVTISPQGVPGGPRLDGVVSRERAQDELDELEPFMCDGWTTVMVELREVQS